MKQSIILFLFLISFSSYSQKKREDILKDQIGSITLRYTRSIDLDKGDTLRFVYLGFQNAKYSTLTDTKSLFFTKDDVLKQFIKDIKVALGEVEKGEKTNMNWDRKPNYKLDLFDFSNNLYITEGGGTGGYTSLSKKQTSQLIEKLEQIKFLGSDELILKN